MSEGVKVVQEQQTRRGLSRRSEKGSNFCLGLSEVLGQEIRGANRQEIHPQLSHIH